MANFMYGSDFYLERSEQHTDQVINDSNIRMLPPTVRMVQLRGHDPVIHPDTEENVEAQTEEVFLNFVYQSYRNDTMRGETDNLQPVTELLNFTASPISPAAEIGRHLARIGDDINEKYADMFDGMISALNLSLDAESSYQAFTSIGQRVFAQGTNWGRIMTLLVFGYRIAMTVLRKQTLHFASFLTRIVSFVCRFVVSQQISKWIADHGGWRAALNYIPSASLSTFLLVSGLAAFSVLAVVTFNRFLK
uniref:Bcl-2 Bcl-2 homology region 1-3 domain-containing protein n=1 Tax=Arion vulgaris TaxID=1028688 RepID=A0A0B6ZL18_9EUPU